MDFREGEDFAPVLDGSFVGPMLETMKKLAPFYRFLLAGKERAAAGREVPVRYFALDFETGNARRSAPVRSASAFSRTAGWSESAFRC